VEVADLAEKGLVVDRVRLQDDGQSALEFRVSVQLLELLVLHLLQKLLQRGG